MDQSNFVEEIKALCTGDKMPDQYLFNEGKLPEGWIESYLSLLTSNRIYWQNIEKWPRDLFYCFYRVGFHLGFAYGEWSKLNETTNTKTENELNKIRLFTEAFIVGDAEHEWITET